MPIYVNIFIIMFLCYSIFKQKRDAQKASLQKSGVDDGDRTHDPQDHNLIL